MKLSCIMETLTNIPCLPHIGVRPIEAELLIAAHNRPLLMMVVLCGICYQRIPRPGGATRGK
jgi:hypothetical protein